MAGSGANQAIIRTDVASYGNNGSSYSNELYLINSAPAALMNYSRTTAPVFSNNGGATVKYIEGKLKRNVSSNNTYDFPIGVASG